MQVAGATDTLTIDYHRLGLVLLATNALHVAGVLSGKIGRGVEQLDRTVPRVLGRTRDGVVGVNAAHEPLYDAASSQFNDPLVNWRRVIVQKPFND